MSVPIIDYSCNHIYVITIACAHTQGHTQSYLHIHTCKKAGGQKKQTNTLMNVSIHTYRKIHLQRPARIKQI